MAPAGTPADIIKKLNAAIDEATRDPQVRELAPKLGFELDPKGAGSPEDAAAFLKVAACAVGEDHPGPRHRAAIGLRNAMACVNGIRSVAVDVCALDEAAAFYSADVEARSPVAVTVDGARYFRGTAAYHHILSLHRADNVRRSGGSCSTRRIAMRVAALHAQREGERGRYRGAARMGRARRRLRFRLQGPGGTQSRGRVRRRTVMRRAPAAGPAAQDHARQSQCGRL